MKRLLRKSRLKWKDNIKIYLRIIWRNGLDRINEAQDRVHWRTLVNVVINLWVPYKTREFLDKLSDCAFLRRTLFHGVSYVDIRSASL